LRPGPLLTAFGSPYHSLPNGNASEIKLTARQSSRADFVSVHCLHRMKIAHDAGGLWCPQGERLCALVAAEGVDAHQDDRKRFVVQADEKLTAFLERELVTRG